MPDAIVTGVVDIRSALGLPIAPLDTAARIIVTRVDGLEVGIVAEAVVEMIEAPRSSLQPPLLTIESERGRYASSILQQKDEQLVIILNLPSLLQALKV